MTKCVVITGSNGGIGKALVQTFLDDDYLVLGLDKDFDQHIKSKKIKEIDTDLYTFAKDQKYRHNLFNKMKALLPDQLEEFILINNAAEQILESISDIDWNNWEKSIAVNTVAPFFLVQGFIDHLTESKGSVINISSIHSRLTKSRFTSYAASKSALESLTRSLAIELSPLGISINAIAPAAIDTQMLQNGLQKNLKKIEKLKILHPSQSIGSPKELAFFIKSIAEIKGKFLTGSVIEFTGGIAGLLNDPDN